MSYLHRHRVRYGEVDAQRVVYNAHYLAYCDDAVEAWFEALALDPSGEGWDFMLKRATVEWAGSATLRDVLDITCAVERWGTTSFDVGFTGTVGERPVFTARITYVGVVDGTTTSAPPPPAVRAALGEPVAAPRS
ncbi:MAG: acyl-CoA thioesterase [Acidimicrobiia bacterium]|nr:acyl-CoA thioesterase [Acidimicrobiia bacterium]